jgi:hypothetical protein
MFILSRLQNVLSVVFFNPASCSCATSRASSGLFDLIEKVTHSIPCQLKKRACMHAFRNATIDPSRPFVNSRAAGNYWMAHTHARLIHFGTQREEERTAVYDCTYTYARTYMHACMWRFLSPSPAYDCLVFGSGTGCFNLMTCMHAFCYGFKQHSARV